MISYFKSLTFAQPSWLLLMLIIPALIAFYWWKNKHQIASLQLSGLDWVKNVQPNFKTRFRALPFALRMIALALLIIVMARPQTSNRQKQVHIEGIDIMLAIDISGSMRARDLRPDRLEAAKEVAVNFIKSRPNDRIGLVVFSGEAFTQCPLTTDHTVLIDLFKPIKSGIIEDGTAIGDGLATAVNRIKDSEAISRVIILLTDGVQNMGSIDPITAAEIAKSFGIRVYTIGVGTHGTAPMPVTTPFGEQMMDVEVKIDEPILKKVAQITDGQYFRATYKSSLNKVYAKIDALEKSKIDVNIFQNKTEEFIHFAIAALLLLLADLILRFTIFRIKP